MIGALLPVRALLAGHSSSSLAPVHTMPGAIMVADNPSSQKWQLQVLVVEDEIDTAETLAELIQAFGFAVSIEADGTRALAWAQANHPDVVLLDIGLPGGMDGH